MSPRRRVSWRRAGFGAAALFVVIVTAVVFSGLLTPAPQSAQFKTEFTSQKRLFTAGEHPTLHFKLLNRSTALGSWLHPVAFAADVPTAAVQYQDRRKITTDVAVSPEGDGYKVVVTPDAQMRPGKYTVILTGESGGQPFKAAQTFAWGVVAVNTDKATYLPGETARITMGVLSSKGNTLCDAPVLLKVTTPTGQEQQLQYQNSTSCQGDKFNSEPDYWTDYKVGQTGTYKLTLTLAGSQYSVSDQFYVADSVPFDIQRSGPTRIYPQAPYGIGLHITANQDFSGTITEVLPDAQFKVLDNPMNAKVDYQDRQVVLTWHVDWRAGKTYDLNYQFKAPPVSPAFYYVGPLTFTDTAGQQTYREARAWQIAGDAAITFVKETVLAPGAVNSSTDAVTSTAGNTLILTFNINTANLARCLGSVTDSASNTWVVPAANPNTNPPQNGTTGASSIIAMAYIANAAAITSLTVTQCAAAVQDMAYNVEEFSGIDNTNPVYDSQSGHQDTATTSFVTGTSTLALCDQPTTDQLLRGGQYFCADTSVLVIGLVYGGAQSATPTLTAGYTALTPQVANSGTQTVRAFPAYAITSTSGAASFTYTVNNSKAYAWCLMVFRVSGAGDNSQAFFWAE